MSPDRWRRIEEVYHAARDRPVNERDVFLAAACQDDSELRKEVETLLEQQSGSLLDGPAWEQAPSLMGRQALEPGAQLGPYRVTGALGSGGMGEVYKARDMRLGRDVAIKVLPEHLAKDTQARARFEREAKAVAALNHSHICALYDVGPDYLVMELVEGATLAERITLGAIPLEEALRIARQIAEALEAAHEKGIVHRDLKPANIKLTPQGAVKVLDFGLATVARGPSAIFDDPENSPTRTATLSREGVILGTAAYMAPEQARAQVVDKRADIWAFGVILYEMLTGKRLFEGDTTTEVLSMVLTKEPVWERVPAPVRPLLRCCLEKEPKRRLRDIGDAWKLLEESPAEGSADDPRDRPRLYRRVLIAVALAVMTLIGWAAARFFSTNSNRTPLTWRVSLTIPMDVIAPEIAPDGSALLFRSADGLHVRRMDSLESTLLTKGATLYPFWSPDSRSIAFFSEDFSLRKMRVPGGALETIAGRGNRGGTWGRDGSILLSAGNGGLFLVPPGGGQARKIAIPSMEGGAFFIPSFLPDGKDFLFAWKDWRTFKSGIYLATLQGGTLTRQPILLRAGTSAGRFSPALGGELMFVDNDRLYAQHLNARAGRLEGEATLIAENVFSMPANMDANFSVSSTGVLVWRPGQAYRTQLTWFDRAGKMLGTIGPPGNYLQVRMAPDGSKVAAWSRTGGALLIAAGEHTGINIPRAVYFAWSALGDRLITEPLEEDSLSERSIGDLEHQTEIARPGPHRLQDLSSDGKFVLYFGRSGLVALPITSEASGRGERRVASADNTARFSPDGRWVVYDDSGSVFVKRFTDSALRKQISENAAFPIWRGDGKEILFVKGFGITKSQIFTNATKVQLCSIPIDVRESEVRVGKESCLFTIQPPMDALQGYPLPYDVTRDGARILLAQPLSTYLPDLVHVIPDWTSVLRP